jgi:peptidyl-prolyl cis-trans isomerase D
MLQKIRDKVSGIVATVFLGAIAVVFIFWGLDFKSTANMFAAKVDGEKISVEEIRRAWQQRQQQLQQMLRDELPESLVKAQQAALLDKAVRERLLRQRAKQFGYRVSDEALAKRVMEYPQFQVDGKFDPDRYAALLQQNGLTTTGFEAELQTELLLTQIQNGVIDSSFTTPAELARRYSLEKQQREVDYALIAAADFATGVTLTDEKVQKWYDDHKSDYMTRETVDLQYLELTRASAESAVTVTEKELRDYYDTVKERFESPERRKARHILITTGDGVDDAQAKKKADDLFAAAKGGTDFAKLAKDNSKDPGSAEQGGDLGWAQKGMFVGPFEEALFSMTAGEIRGPVKTQFGYHVIKLDEIEAPHVKTFDEARADLEADYRKERAEKGFYDASEQLGEKAFAALTELDSVAKAMNLQLKTIPGYTREGGGEFGPEPSIIQAAFSEDVVERGQNSQVVPVGDDRAVVVRVTNHKPSEPRPLADVRAQIETQMRQQAIRDAAAAKGAEAVARLQKGEAWAAVTLATGLKPVGKRFVDRDDKIAPRPVLTAAFDAAQSQVTEAKPYYAGIVTDDGNYAVIEVSQVKNADPAAESATDKMARQKRIERQTGNEEFAGYVSEAERRAKIVKNPNVFE